VHPGGPPSLHQDTGGPPQTNKVQPGNVPPYNSTTVEQHYKLFIKEGLKHKVKQRVEESKINDIIKEPKKEPEELTEEDEERRRRRRERNKVAATKCRNKKKEKTCLLVSEGELLEAQNKNLKQEISRLEAEKRHLVEILALHEPTCAKRPRRETNSNEDDKFRIPAVPPQRGPPRFRRQDSLMDTLEILENLDDIDQLANIQSNNKSSSGGKEAAPGKDSGNTYKSCSFSRSKPSYFLVNKPKSLSYSGFRMDNRCIAL